MKWRLLLTVVIYIVFLPVQTTQAISSYDDENVKEVFDRASEIGRMRAEILFCSTRESNFSSLIELAKQINLLRAEQIGENSDRLIAGSDAMYRSSISQGQNQLHPECSHMREFYEIQRRSVIEEITEISLDIQREHFKRRY